MQPYSYGHSWKPPPTYQDPYGLYNGGLNAYAGSWLESPTAGPSGGFFRQPPAATRPRSQAAAPHFRPPSGPPARFGQPVQRPMKSNYKQPAQKATVLPLYPPVLLPQPLVRSALPLPFRYDRFLSPPPQKPAGYAPKAPFFNSPPKHLQSAFQPPIFQPDARPFFGAQAAAPMHTPNPSMPENFKPCRGDCPPGADGNPKSGITINVHTFATRCTIEWFLPHFEQRGLFVDVCLYQGVEETVTEGGVPLQKISWMPLERRTHNLGSRWEEFALRPGGEYRVVVHVLTVNGNVVIDENQRDFRAVYSQQQLEELLGLATNVVGFKPKKQFHVLYRCKPSAYFDEELRYGGGFMRPYRKSTTGHPASPINASLKGLFFSARLLKGGHLPSVSCFGDTRFTIEAARLLDPSRVNFYFADFYCISEAHYATVVVCLKGSPQDLFCRQHALPLNPHDNPFLIAYDPFGYGQHLEFRYNGAKGVNLEILYAAPVPLDPRALHRVVAVRAGTSDLRGKKNNKNCTTCNTPADLAYWNVQPQEESFASTSSAVQPVKPKRKRSRQSDATEQPAGERKRANPPAQQPKPADASGPKAAVQPVQSGVSKAAEAPKEAANPKDAAVDQPQQPATQTPAEPTESGSKDDDDDEIVFLCEMPASRPLDASKTVKPEVAPTASAAPAVIPTAPPVVPDISADSNAPPVVEATVQPVVPALISADVPSVVPEDPQRTPDVSSAPIVPTTPALGSAPPAALPLAPPVVLPVEPPTA